MGVNIPVAAAGEHVLGAVDLLPDAPIRVLTPARGNLSQPAALVHHEGDSVLPAKRVDHLACRDPLAGKVCEEVPDVLDGPRVSQLALLCKILLPRERGARAVLAPLVAFARVPTRVFLAKLRVRSARARRRVPEG